VIATEIMCRILASLVMDAILDPTTTAKKLVRQRLLREHLAQRLHQRSKTHRWEHFMERAESFCTSVVRTLLLTMSFASIEGPCFDRPTSGLTWEARRTH